MYVQTYIGYVWVVDVVRLPLFYPGALGKWLVELRKRPGQNLVNILVSNSLKLGTCFHTLGICAHVCVCKAAYICVHDRM